MSLASAYAADDMLATATVFFLLGVIAAMLMLWVNNRILRYLRMKEYNTVHYMTDNMEKTSCGRMPPLVGTQIHKLVTCKKCRKLMPKEKAP